MTPGPGIEPGTHWWEASALTTAPTNSSIHTCLEISATHILAEKLVVIIRKRNKVVR